MTYWNGTSLSLAPFIMPFVILAKAEISEKSASHVAYYVFVIAEKAGIHYVGQSPTYFPRNAYAGKKAMWPNVAM